MVEPSKFAPSLVSVDSVNTHFQSVGVPENASSLVSVDSLTAHFQLIGGAKFAPSLAGGVSDTTHFQSQPSSKFKDVGVVVVIYKTTTTQEKIQLSDVRHLTIRKVSRSTNAVCRYTALYHLRLTGRTAKQLNQMYDRRLGTVCYA